MATAPSALPDLFRSLADPTRLRILRALERSELTVGELADVLGMAQSGISRHLAVLKAAGLANDRREGSSSFYRLAQSPDDARAQALWPMVREWLGDLPQAEADGKDLDRVLSHRNDRAAAYFQEVAPRWDSLRAAQYGEDLRHLALLELLPRELTVLDVGTGTGFMLLGVAPRVERFIGVDRSAAMLEQARRNLAAAGFPKADLREGSIESLPVDTASVDVVLANMVLHHATEPRDALREMARVLRPGGRVVLTDLAQHDLAWTRDALADEWPGFAQRELEKFFGSAGLGDVAVRPIGTCTLVDPAMRTKHPVDVLLATGVKPRAKGRVPVMATNGQPRQRAPRTARGKKKRDMR